MDATATPADDNQTVAAALAAFRDTVHVPSDAGVHAEALERMLRRIPPGWGRWISCDAGWYQLLVDTDTKLAELDNSYEIHQVKEKFGTLRFYIGFPEILPPCCETLDNTDPRPHPGAITGPYAPKDRSPEHQQQLEAWFERRTAHLNSDDHTAGKAARNQDPRITHRKTVTGQMNALIRAVETRSAVTCETCGNPGELNVRGGWYKTLCSTCAASSGYQTVPHDH